MCKGMSDPLRALVSEYPTYEVVITGHGLGGALAALCGYWMEMGRVFPVGTPRSFVSFGAPRSGNAHWARKFQQIFPSAIRVTHADDPVVSIPTCHHDEDGVCIELKDRKKPLWAFHFPTQIHYPGEMPHFESNDIGNYKVRTHTPLHPLRCCVR
jgi:hypothetical protein